ncbi:RNA polymerase sigma-F factor, partial [Staphylococcus sp. SIMBA_130]
PTVNEIAERIEVTPEEVVLAQEAVRAPSSIHETGYENDGDPITLLDQIADNTDTAWFDKLALKEALQYLDTRERLIVYLRYY